MPVDIRINFANHRIASDIQKAKPNGGNVSSWVATSDYHLTLAHSDAVLSPSEQKVLKEIVERHMGDVTPIPISVASSGYGNDPNPIDFGRSGSFAKLHISDQGITKLQSALISELNQKIPGKNFVVANPPHITIAKQSSKFSEQEKADLWSVAKNMKGLNYGTVTTVECVVGNHVDNYGLGTKKASTVSTPTSQKAGFAATTDPSGKTEIEKKSLYDSEEQAKRAYLIHELHHGAASASIGVLEKLPTTDLEVIANAFQVPPYIPISRPKMTIFTEIESASLVFTPTSAREAQAEAKERRDKAFIPIPFAVNQPATMLQLHFNDQQDASTFSNFIKEFGITDRAGGSLASNKSSEKDYFIWLPKERYDFLVQQGLDLPQIIKGSLPTPTHLSNTPTNTPEKPHSSPRKS